MTENPTVRKRLGSLTKRGLAMTENLFPYPGGKSNYAKWIVDHIPEHSCFVEAFGGAAGVLINKPRSHSEVYNDINDDLVVFFRTLRQRPNDLRTYLRRLPYSRSEYERIARAWFDDGERPSDDVKRSAWFYYLRYANFSGKLTKAGFSTSARADDNRARRFKKSIDEIKSFAERFNDVTVENLDYRDLVEQYDKSHTLFYFDPPYVDVGDSYYDHIGEFDHSEFVDTLGNIEGKWIVSYNQLPPGLDGYTIVERTTRYTMSSEGHTENTERLVMNYDPTEEAEFTPSGQTTLSTSVTATDGGGWCE